MYRNSEIRYQILQIVKEAPNGVASLALIANKLGISPEKRKALIITLSRMHGKGLIYKPVGSNGLYSASREAFEGARQ